MFLKQIRKLIKAQFIFEFTLEQHLIVESVHVQYRMLPSQ